MVIYGIMHNTGGKKMGIFQGKAGGPGNVVWYTISMFRMLVEKNKDGIGLFESVPRVMLALLDCGMI